MGEFIRDRLPDPIDYYVNSECLTLIPPRGKWRSTRCVFHDSDGTTMRINVESGGFVCMAACGASGGDVLAFHMQRYGLDFIEAARALGAYIEDDRPHRGPTRPATLPARDALQVVAFESLVVATAAGNIANGVALTDEDRRRVLQAAGRIGYLAAEVRA